MGKKEENLISTLPFKWLIAATLIFNIIIISLVFILKNKLPPELPLFYGLPEGEEQLAPTLTLSLPSAISISILIFNTALSLLIDNEFLRKTLVASAFVASFFSIIATFKIFLLVGSF